jgi:hypothetical protein
VSHIATCATLLQYPDEILGTYLGKQLKRMQHTSKTLKKNPETLEKTCVAIAKHIQHPETLATYVRNT